MMRNSKTGFVGEKRPLKTDSDYAEMKKFISEVEKKAKEDSSLKMELLLATGMYDKDGILKKKFR